MPKITLKKGRDASLLRGHPWIFSGALKEMPDVEPGTLVEVYSADKTRLGSAYLHPKQSLCARMVSRGDQDPIAAVRDNLKKAIDFRKRYVLSDNTTACRLVNAEADLLPGLIVDLYNDVAVIQIGTWGMERLKEVVIEELQSIASVVVERSSSSSRTSEGLKPCSEVHFGTLPDEIEFFERGVKLIAPLTTGQKTGFFLDQRENRFRIQDIALGKTLLNCFSYSGGFSLYALAGGATKVDSVDVSQKALDLIPRQQELNNLKGESYTHCQDVFEYIEGNELDQDIVILDPPAFAKKKRDVPNAIKGYRNLNTAALKKMKSGSILLTCSCSYFMERGEFEKVIKQAALQAGRQVQFLSREYSAWDHASNLYCPETSYLKCVWLQVL